MRKITTKEILEDLKNVFDYLQKIPTTIDYDEFGKYSVELVYKHFKTWQEALHAAGINATKRHITIMISDEEMLADLKSVARQLGRQPLKREYEKIGKYSSDNYRKRFGSWKAAFEKSGLKFKSQSRFDWTFEKLKQDLERVRREINSIPTLTDYAAHGTASPDTLKRHADTKKWSVVLVKYLGVERGAARAYSTNRKELYRTTEERLQELRDLAKRLRHSPNTKEAEKYGINRIKLCRRLGTFKWNEVLEKAGLPKPTYRKRRKTDD